MCACVEIRVADLYLILRTYLLSCSERQRLYLQSPRTHWMATCLLTMDLATFEGQRASAVVIALS